MIARNRGATSAVLVALFVCLILSVFAAWRSVQAQSMSNWINYQGRLTQPNGAPVADAKYDVEFRLFDNPSGGTALWQETQNVTTKGGVFSTTLGRSNAFDARLFTKRLWLETEVAGRVLKPRQELGSVAFAMTALSFPDSGVTTAMIANLSVTTEKLADGSVTTPKMADGAVTAPKLADGVVTSAKVADGSVSAADLADDESSLSRVSGAGMSIQDGKVGIGTAPVTHRLDIMGPDQHLLRISSAKEGIGAGMILRTTGTDGRAWELLATGIGSAQGADKLNIRSLWDNSDSMTITGDSKIGIGELNPQAKLHVNGNLIVTGSKSAMVGTASYGNRLVYCAEAPESRFFDEGVGQTKDGVATVRLDPVFVETIEGAPVIHLTPYGPSSLYVAERHRDHFVVRSMGGGADVEFAWRLSALRKGYANMRLPKAGETLAASQEKVGGKR